MPVPVAVLRVISPNTAAINARLRPEVREQLPGEAGPQIPRPNAFPISLSPPDTRDFFVSLFALTLLYAAARSNLAGRGPLRRFAWVLAVNGVLLCMLGIAQRVSSPPHVVYWSLWTPGGVFGPFINRNHMPFYANICLGLAAALLAAQFPESIGDILTRPTVLWLMAIVGVTGFGIAFSQSRGGIMSALTATIVCLFVWFRHSQRAGGLAWAICAILAMAVIGSWVGWSQVMSRIGTVETDQVAKDVRMDIWLDGLRLFARYPTLGTGCGTYTWVEPMIRTRSGFENESVEYAHNEYVEALAEGGLPRLALILLLVVWPVTRLIRRHVRVIDRPEAGLLLGGLYGLLAIAMHSFFDFGMHMPAVAVLAVVFLACLMSAADRHGTKREIRSFPIVALGALALGTTAVLLSMDAFERISCRSLPRSDLGCKHLPRAHDRAGRADGSAALGREHGSTRQCPIPSRVGAGLSGTGADSPGGLGRARAIDARCASRMADCPRPFAGHGADAFPAWQAPRPI